jgi:hypothetical protein
MNLRLEELATRVIPPSVTYWYRLEPRPRGVSLAEPTAAPVRDPLWFLTRQWQMGEFLAEDAGSPAYCQIASSSGSLTAWNTGDAPFTPIPADTPLEPLVEREQVTPDLALSVELGQTFEQLLDEQGGTPAQRDAFRAAFPLQLPFDADPETARFFSICSGRATDGVALLRAAQAGAAMPPSPGTVIADFQTWVAEVFGEIGTSDPPAWDTKVLQYDVRVTGDLPGNAGGEFSVVAARDGAFDWFAFDLVNAAENQGLGAAQQNPTLNIIPAHVRFRGMPNAKWWDFENNITDFGGIDVQRHELAKLAVMDFMLLHGNDWFVVPVDVPVNSIYRIDQFLVRDVFGGLTLIDRTDRVPTPAGRLWTMFSTVAPRGVSDFFLLPPTAAVAMQPGFILENVRFLRDPTANMDWAIEHQTEGGIGQPLLGAEEDARKRLTKPSVALVQQGAVVRYQIESSVPRDWFPFVPVATGNVVNEVVLRLGELLPDIHGLPVLPRGRLLPPIAELREQEIPRTGLEITRRNILTRWLNGRTHSWIARRRTSGQGEGSSSLRFDLAIPELPAVEAAAPPPVTGGTESGTVGAVLETGGDLVAPRFFGDDVLASCLSGHRIFAGSGDPPETVARIQQALADLGFAVDPDGNFGPLTGAAVTDYKTGKGISPNDPVVGPQTMAALDRDFAHELFDAKAEEVSGTRFDLGARIGVRVDLDDGLATCAFEKGICVEVGHLVAYAMPAVVASAWLASGGADGSMGLPANDPIELDATRYAQEFASSVRIFGGASDFDLPLNLWEAYLAGQGMTGVPNGPPQPLVTVAMDPEPVLLPQVVVRVVDAIPLSLGQGETLSLDQLAALAAVPGMEGVIAAIRALLPNLVFRRLYDSVTPEDIQKLVGEAVANDPTYAPPLFENFLEVVCPAGFDAAPLVAALKLWAGVVRRVYANVPTEPAIVVGTTNPFFGKQGYLSPAPAGVGVQSAWARGADGTGVGLIDMEHAWFLGHEDLPSGIPLLRGVNRPTSRGHGAGVLGVLAAIDNTVGVAGMAPATNIRLMSPLDVDPALSDKTDHVGALIFHALLVLKPGDVLLLELQGTGGLPVESLEHILLPIQMATAKGVIVVEAAGNGSNDLDAFRDPTTNNRVLNRLIPGEFLDSGAILVSASISAVPHSRDAESSFGSRVDCYAWGENVFTTGRRQDPVGPKDYFNFSGTSSAAAIIAGVCVLMQHLKRITSGSPTASFTPAEMRSILSDLANTTPSLSGGDRIGRMPDFDKLLAKAF